MYYEWKTKKINNNCFEYTVSKVLSLEVPINGVYAITAIEKRSYEKTRARAKSQAQKWHKYFTAQLKKQA